MTTIIIRPNQSWLHIDWQGLREYRDLLYLLVRRDFVSKYQQTILGPLWFIINPLITTIIFTLIFGRMIGIKTDGINPALFYLCSLIAWSYFAAVLEATSTTFVANVNLFNKVYFPRLIVPFAIAASNLYTLAIQTGAFLAIYIVYAFTGRAAGLAPTPYLLLLPLLVLQMALLALGAGMIFSAVTAKYRDFYHLSRFIVQIWMFVTPIIYPLSQLTQKIPAPWQWIPLLNPMTIITESFRLAFMGAGTFTVGGYALSLALTAATFLTGLFLFQRAARTAVDTL